MDITQAMRYRIDSEIEIEATPEQVWKVFADFGSYSKWNDFQVFKKVPEAVGKKCEVVFHLEGGCMKTSSHDPEILVLDPNRELRWRDYRGPILSSFFRGSHWWILEPLPNGHTRFLHGAEMFGLALPFLRPTMHAIRRGYDVFNKALRKEVLAQLQQEKTLTKEELQEVFAAPKAQPTQELQAQKAPQHKGHKLQGHKSSKKLLSKGHSVKRAAGRPVVTVMAGGEGGEVQVGPPVAAV